jgi:hypothetical protein
MKEWIAANIGIIIRSNQSFELQFLCTYIYVKLVKEMLLQRILLLQSIILPFPCTF